MNPAARKSLVLLVGLSTVIPCGMALTALAALILGAARAWHAGALQERTIPLLILYLLWSLAGVFGLISLVQSADSLLVSRQRLRWREFFGTVVGILSAGAFAYAVLLRPNTGFFLRGAYLAPAIIGIGLIVLHFYYLFRPNPFATGPSRPPVQPAELAHRSTDGGHET
ncbi:hypothetical protein DB347_19795 [Opitutaceae bacterium EW11]|nr:hypothetical protein DB347_19795 [Opitutaceae bacterium EW11]